MRGGLKALLFLLSGVIPFTFSIFLGPGTGCSGATTPTGPAEIPGPVNVDGLNPPDGATDFAPSASLTIPFTEPMNRSSVEAAFSLSPEAEAAALVKWQAVSGSFTWSDDSTEMTFDPAALEPLTRYCMRIGAGALTADGDEIPAFESCFTTGESSCPSADDPSAYETIFDGDCNFTPGSTPDENSTFDYDVMVAGAASQGWSNQQLGCLFNAACLAGETQCVTMTTIMSVAEGCGIGGGGTPFGLVNATRDACLSDGYGANCHDLPNEDEVFTIPDLGSSTVLFSLYADYIFDGDNYEDAPGVIYWVVAIEKNRYCLGDCWAGPSVSSCNDKSYCPVNVTGQEINSFLTARVKLDAFNGGQCVDMWWEWDANTPDGQMASNLLHVRLQKSDGICP